MKKALYRAILTAVIFFGVSHYTKEADVPSETFYMVGNYIIKEKDGKYQSRKGAIVSPWCKTMYKSIKSISKSYE
jgi:hypothetical protein